MDPMNFWHFENVNKDHIVRDAKRTMTVTVNLGFLLRVTGYNTWAFMIFYAFFSHNIPTNVALSKEGIKVVFRESFGRIRVENNQLRRIRESQNQRIEKLSSFRISLDGVTCLVVIVKDKLVSTS
jgi:hypothetical protein